MDATRDYTALAAECERRAAAGEGPIPGFWRHVPAVEDILDDDFGTTISQLECWGSPVATITNEEADAEGHRVYINGSCVHAIHSASDSDDSPEELERKDAIAATAAQLFAEALLRDATKPLHREAYEQRDTLNNACWNLRAELDTTKAMLHETHGQIAEMCEYLGLKREEVPCDAWQLRDALIRLRAENERLRAALREAMSLAEQMPAGCDKDAKDEDEYDIQDMSAHIAGLIWQQAANALKEPSNA